ncbi:MAG: TrpR-like protein, YerC/YecD [Clostridia bacterium]|nr:TrpR-like protein, YerC/YecD [Clostridia bacterium]
MPDTGREKMKNDHNENIEFMYKGIVSLETVEDCKSFFEDICTKSELFEMSRRLKAAKMLSDGMVYSEIATRTGLSTATISRVNHCLKYGSNGYLNVLKKLEIDDKQH